MATPTASTNSRRCPAARHGWRLVYLRRDEGEWRLLKAWIGNCPSPRLLKGRLRWWRLRVINEWSKGLLLCHNRATLLRDVLPNIAGGTLGSAGSLLSISTFNILLINKASMEGTQVQNTLKCQGLPTCLYYAPQPLNVHMQLALA